MAACVFAPGAILASLLKTSVEAGKDVEGLLFGSVCVERVERLQDKASRVGGDSTTHVTTKAHIQDYVVSRSAGEMYDDSGNVRVDVVREMAKRSSLQLIGWFSYKYRSHMVPSLRATAVHASLREFAAGASEGGGSGGGGGGGGGGAGGGGSAAGGAAGSGDADSHKGGGVFLHLALTSRPDGAESTRAFGYKVFMPRGESRSLHPVSLTIPNLVTEETKKYSNLSVASPLDRGILRTVVDKAGWKPGDKDGADAPQVRAAEQVFLASDEAVVDLIEEISRVEEGLARKRRLAAALKQVKARKGGPAAALPGAEPAGTAAPAVLHSELPVAQPAAPVPDSEPPTAVPAGASPGTQPATPPPPAP